MIGRVRVMHPEVMLIVASVTTAAARRLASVADVQPHWRDEVHVVWPFGPTHSSKLGGNWPGFNAHGDYCSPSPNNIFTGYHDNGQVYCKAASSELDDHAHLMIYTGRFGLVFDAAVKGGNFLPLLDGISAWPKSAMIPADVYAALSAASLHVTLELDCAGAMSTYKLGPKATHLETGLVRQGHAMTHIILADLEWKKSDTGASLQTCARTKDPDNANCASDRLSNNHACTKEGYPTCLGFQQGKSWGKCWSGCPPTRNHWLEVSMWGDHATLQLDWDNTAFAAGCTGVITMSIVSSGAEISRETAILSDNGVTVSLAVNSNGTVVQKSDLGLSDVQVTSNGHVLTRTSMQDIFVEVPSSVPKCQYKPCGDKLGLVDVQVANVHALEGRSLRLSVSRNFPTGITGYAKSSPGAEITGLNVIVLDAATKRPTGIPCQISKNWHDDANAKYAGYHGYWWTANVFLRLPANSSIALTFAVTYELYGGVSAFSHAQLSIVGYSNKWLWEQSALGTGGENMCFDPLGLHTRASITDVRVKLFDGNWKENVGGGEMFPTYFDEQGVFQYLKAVDPLIHTSGPCLSNASYEAHSRDNAIAARIQVSGGRTDDFVRVFFHVRLRALKTTKFSRLAFFQMGAETYNYNANFDRFVVGSGANKTHDLPRTCTGGASRSRDKMYTNPNHETIEGDGPWWVSFGPNHHTPAAGKEHMVVGDRGLVIRTFAAQVSGQILTRPSFSILCDKLELGAPAGLDTFSEGDFLDMRLEFMVLPKDATDYSTARDNSGSNTLVALNSLSTWERVRAQAIGHLTIVPVRNARVELHYPVRVCDSDGSSMVMFHVHGTALGFVPIIICDLTTHDIPLDTGLWMRQAGQAVFTRVSQQTHTDSDFYQVNYDRITQRYEAVFNVELVSPGTQVAFGTNPMTWTTLTTTWTTLTTTQTSSTSTAGIASATAATTTQVSSASTAGIAMSATIESSAFSTTSGVPRKETCMKLSKDKHVEVVKKLAKHGMVLQSCKP